MAFEGFQSAKEKLTPIPETFFTDILTEINKIGELKVVLYAFWFLNQQPKDMQYLTLEDLQADPVLTASLQPEPVQALAESLAGAVRHNVLIRVTEDDNELYFLNTPRGRAAVKAYRSGNWEPEPETRQPAVLRKERPNIFRLYEENIGPLTPLISEILQDAEDSYPVFWLEDAIQIAVEKNVRNWRYIDAILKSWQKEGRSEKDRRNTQEDRRKYIDGEYSDIIEY